MTSRKRPAAGAKRKKYDATRRVEIKPERGLHLVIESGGQVVRSAEIAHASRRVLQAPFLEPRNLPQIRETRRELVLETLDRDGNVLDAFGWNWIGEAFYDRPAERQRVPGPSGRVKTIVTLRVLRLPLRAGATFLVLSRSAVDAVSRPDQVDYRGLFAYRLVDAPPPLRRLPRGLPALQVLPLPGPVRLA